MNLGDKGVFGDEGMRILGYPVWGGWLPFIGFRTFQLTAAEVYEATDGEVNGPAEFSPFVIEWLCKGMCFGALKIQQR